MGYGVGVDLGTTWTAAAVVVREGGEPQMVSLGTRSAAVPTVVALQQDGTFAVGDAGARRAVAEPERVVREFKRRVGDTVPVLLAGQPWAPEALLSAVLGWVLARVAQQEGGPADDVVVTFPANWGPLRRVLLEQAAVTAGGVRARFTTEPEAAAIHYASQERIADGTIVAVYDFGGGTFDSTVLRKTADGFEVLGRPEGVERLGGLDIDAALLAHVTAGLGPAWSGLDPDDPAQRAAAARLRDDVVVAKEALSEDADVSVAVQLPTLNTEVRVTRGELEALVRPMVERSADALAAAITGAGLTPADVDRILLVGGSSRIPLVSEVLTTRFGRPLALDAHPKHAVALGAARLAAVGTPATAPVAPAWPAAPTAPVAAAWPTAAVPVTTAPATAPVPAAAGPSNRTPLLVGGAIAAVVVLIIAVLALGGGGGGDDDPDDVTAAADDETTTTEATTTTVAAVDPRFSTLADAGDVTLELVVASCAGADQCVPGDEQFSLPAVVACAADDDCTFSLDGGEPAPLEVLGDELVAAGAAAPERGLQCSGVVQPTTYEVRFSGTPSALAGSLRLDAEAASTCGARSRTYDMTVLLEELVRAAPVDIVGGWFFDGAAVECTGLAECDAFRASFRSNVEVLCDQSGCGARIASAEPVVLQPSALGLPFTSGGPLPDADGFSCDGAPDPTTWQLEVTSIAEGGGSWTGRITLFSAAGSVDGNSCVEERVVAEGTASPA